MWVTFLKDFDFSPRARGGRVTIAYKAGMHLNITRECASKARAARAINGKSDENQKLEPPEAKDRPDAG